MNEARLLAAVFALAYFVAKVSSQGTLSSIGLYGNNNEAKWAFGISSLQFQFSVNPNAFVYPFELQWVIDDIVIANLNNAKGMPCRSYPINLISSVTCGIQDSNIISNLTLNTSNWEKSQSVLKVQDVNRVVASMHINFAECPQRIANGANQTLHVLPNLNMTAAYNTTATCRCQPGTLYYSNGTDYSGEARCNAYAQWDRCYDAQCWFAPATNIILHPFFSSNIYMENENLEIDCGFKPGYPTVGNKSITITRNGKTAIIQENETSFTLSYKDHNAIIRCSASNSIGRNATEKMLNVLFTPRILETPACNKVSDDNFAITIVIIGNPILEAKNASLRISGGGTYNDTGSWAKEDYRLTYKLNIPNPVKASATFKVRIYMNDSYYINNSTQLNLSCEGKSTTVAVTITQTPDTANRPKNSTRSLQSATASSPSLSVNTTDRPSTGSSGHNDSPLSVGAIVGIACGGFLLLILTTILIVRIIHRRKTAELSGDANVNPAFVGSSGSPSNPKHENRENIFYVTSDDLKSGGYGSGEMVDNVLYGSTPAPRDTNGSDANQELYSVVQKTKKTKGKAKGVDPGASTSGLQSDDTYAEVNKDRKKKKDGKKAGKGQENSGFAGDAQQDATYAVVDKKKNKGAKGKKAEEPGTSGLVEEATYAVVNKKDKKPRKDGPDDDLHGSNKS